MKSADMHGLV